MELLNSSTKEVQNGNLPLPYYLKKLEQILLLAYAAVLPVSLTMSWVVFIAGAITSLILLLLKKHEAKQLIKAPLAIPLFLFFVAVFVSGLCVGGIAEAFNSIFSLRALLIYLWAYLIFSSDRKQVFYAVQVLLVSGSIAGLWGAVQQITNFHPFSYHYLQGTGFFANPMAFAGQMQLLSLLSICFLLSKAYQTFVRPLNSVWVFSTVTILNCCGVLFASERSAWIGFLIAVLIVTAIWSWKDFVKAVAGLAVLGVFSWKFIPVVKKRLLPLLDWQKDVSVRVRFRLWDEAIKLWEKHPISGVGIRRFPHFKIPEAIVPGHSVDINHAHNNYLHIAATTGTLGFLSFIWIWIVALKCAFQTCFNSAREFPERTLAIGIAGGIIALLVAGLFEYNFGTAQVRLMQWFLLAMLISVPADQSA